MERYRNKPEVKERQKKYIKEYRQKNLEKLRKIDKEKYEQRKSERMDCECGVNIIKVYYKGHLNTLKHIRYMRSKNSENSLETEIEKLKI